MGYSPWGRKELAMTERAHTQVMRLEPSQVRLAPHQRLQRAPVPLHYADTVRGRQQGGAHQTRLDHGRPEPHKCLLFITLHRHPASQSKSATVAGMGEDA